MEAWKPSASVLRSTLKRTWFPGCVCSLTWRVFHRTHGSHHMCTWRPVPAKVCPHNSGIPCFYCMGTITVELYWLHAPKTCKNFAELARRGYYNGTKFHRVIKDFMVQGGDPTGTGRGGASIFGKQFEDELHPELKFTGAGILAMANAGPDSNGSQFFLTLAPSQWLDGKHSIFGRVCQGLGTLNRLGMVETDAQDRPLDDVRILRAYPSG